ncbi:MAG: acetyl-CoA decarbonylase/synthase complex subunit gamma [Candidatus Omnitrophota bacterium]|nr:acetyl-CoA decarbonylase/synthase complex subunit gamma [Candidatus Omnitrophota bacterium]
MALSGLDIYKLLPKTNCRQCNFATCLAFAMQLAKKSVSIEKCPHLSADAKAALEASSLPPVKLVTVGTGERKLEIGNETVMFRHEEKFHHPCGLGFIIDDSESDELIKEKLRRINLFKFERVGQELNVDLVAVRQKGTAARFIEAVKVASANTDLALVLISDNAAAIKSALTANVHGFVGAGLKPAPTESLKDKRPLIYGAGKNNLTEFAALAKEFNVPLVVSAPDLEELSAMTAELSRQGVNDLVLDTGGKPVAQKIWDLTQARRQALKKSNRSLGYPFLAAVETDDPFTAAVEAAALACKYASIVLIKGTEPWQAVSLMTLRQNIYTDPQKPLQIEPKLYPVGDAGKDSPLLVTTNFSLTYYTVLGEVEASKVPSYILAVDTEGMSVLTAWAAEKFTPEKIASAIEKFGVAEAVSRKKLVLPGYVAVLSGELEEKSGWQVLVGPKEAAGIPSFLKNM